MITVDYKDATKREPPGTPPVPTPRNTQRNMTLRGLEASAIHKRTHRLRLQRIGQMLRGDCMARIGAASDVQRLSPADRALFTALAQCELRRGAPLMQKHWLLNLASAVLATAVSTDDDTSSGLEEDVSEAPSSPSTQSRQALSDDEDGAVPPSVEGRSHSMLCASKVLCGLRGHAFAPATPAPPTTENASVYIGV